MRLSKNKKIFVLLAILSIFALVAVGCGGAEEPPMDEPIEEQPGGVQEDAPVEEPMPAPNDGM